jgi:hypothetical protein
MKNINEMTSDEIADVQKKCEARLDALGKDKVQRWMEEIRRIRPYTKRPWEIAAINPGKDGVYLILEPVSKKAWPELTKFGEIWAWHNLSPKVRLGITDYKEIAIPRILIEGIDLAGGITDLKIHIVKSDEISTHIGYGKKTIERAKNDIQELERVQKLIAAMGER